MVAAEDPRILSWLRKAHETSKWTTSVCTGSLILGAAGILKGLQATTHWYARDSLEKLGAQYLSERVVRQGKIITAAGVSSGIDMALHLAQEVSGPEMAEDHSIDYRIRSKTAFRFWIHGKSRAFDC